MATVSEITERYPQFAWAFEHPTLGPLLQAAADKGWTAVELQGELHKTDWWKTTWADARTLEVLRGTDPAEYNKRWWQTASEVSTLITKLGISHNDPNFNLVGAVTDQWLRYGKDDWAIFNILGGLLDKDHSLVGSDGELAAKKADYREFASQMLLDFDEGTLNKWAINEWRGTDTADNVKNRIRQQAIANYGHLEDQLQRGLTVRDLASPLLNQVARLLEVSPEELDLTGKWRSLIDFQDPDSGKRRMLTGWEAELMARKQTEFQNTKTARDEASELSVRLLEEMGAAKF